MTRWIAALLALLPFPALAQMPPLEDPKAKCVEVDVGTRQPLRKPPPFAGNTIVAGPNGPTLVEIRQAAFKCATSEKGLYYGWGMRNAAGKVVVPYRFVRIMPTSPGGAVVVDDGNYATYTDGVGLKPLDRNVIMLRYVDDLGPCGAVRASGARSLLLYHFAPQSREHALILFHGSETPIVIEGAAMARRVNRLIFAPVDVAGGAKASRVFDLDGNARSGTLGPLSFWQATKPDRGDTCPLGVPDILSEGPSLDRNPAVKDIGAIYFPIGLDGSFYPMPGDAVGIFPLRARQDQLPWGRASNDGEQEYFNDSWGLVFADSQGWSFSLHRGKPLDAISSATGREPRYRNPVRDGATGMLAAQDVRDGSWKVFGAGAIEPMPLGGSFADGRAAFAAVHAQVAAKRAEVAAAQAASAARDADRRAAESVRERERALQAFADAKARGEMCRYRANASLGLAHLNDYYEKCGFYATDADIKAAELAGVSGTLIAIVRERQRTTAAEAYQTRLRTEEYRRRNPGPMPYYPGMYSSAIQNAGNVAVDNIRKNSESWFDQRRKTYREEWQRKQRAY